MIKKLQTTLLLVALFSFSALAQQFTVEGIVTDKATGETLIAVTVQVPGTTRGVVTDSNGKYSIDVASGETLKFTYVGYIEQNIVITNQRTLDVELAPDIESLDELVITGYTAQSRNKITGAISTIDSRQIESVPVASFDQILQGQSPGLYITSGSGQPGASATVRIRGSASINGSSEPLYVVDGVPINSGDFATLNAGDFAAVSVLKDASATAEYGSRGSNGVIVVTTKRGKSGENNVTYKGQYGISSVGTPNFEMMNADQKLTFEEILRTGQGWATSPNNPSNSSVNPTTLAADRQALVDAGRDWSDVFFRDGTTESHELGFSGGNAKTRYYVSGSIFDQQGIGQRSELNRYTMRVNLDFTANDHIDFGFNGQGGYSESSFTESEGGVALANPFAAVYLANPYETLYDADGEIAVGGGQVGANAYDRLQKDKNDRNETKFIGKAFVTYNYKNFVIGTDLAMDYQERDYTRWINPNSYAGSLVSKGQAGQLGKTNTRATRVTSLTNLRYTKTFAEKHNVNVYLANEFIRSYYDSFNYTGYGLNNKLGATPEAITPGSNSNNLIPVVGGGITENTLWSLLSILEYNYNDKYNLKGSLRRDGSSKFGSENQYALLWSLGGSWVATNEDFLNDSDFFNSLIVRASYGKSGNQLGIGDYQRTATFAASSYVGEQTLVPATPGNDNLKWETTYKANIGADFSLFDNRIGGSIDLYNEATEDLFIDQQLSRTSGFTSLEINAGSMRNRGYEINLNGDIISTRDAILTLRVNYAYNDNEITDLGQVDEFEQGTSIIRKGLALGSHYVVGWAGVDPATGAPLYYDLDGNVTTQFSDSYATATFGTWLPPKTGGFGLDFSYKNFSVRSQFNFALDYTRFNNQSYFQENHGFAQFNQRTIMLDIWQNPGDITEIQSPSYARQFSSKDLEDASYLRFRNLTLSYNIPARIFNNQIRGARIFVQGQNLYTWTKYTGFDPEDSNNIASYEYPTPRIFTTGIDINF